jgi:hypothetical protein
VASHALRQPDTAVEHDVPARSCLEVADGAGQVVIDEQLAGVEPRSGAPSSSTFSIAAAIT